MFNIKHCFFKCNIIILNEISFKIHRKWRYTLYFKSLIMEQFKLLHTLVILQLDLFYKLILLLSYKMFLHILRSIINEKRKHVNTENFQRY